jgi:hypothetical protein
MARATTISTAATTKVIDMPAATASGRAVVMAAASLLSMICFNRDSGYRGS